jgi:hypothetical protein
MFTASMGIAMCKHLSLWGVPLNPQIANVGTVGDRFDARADQEAMLNILKKTEMDHARPTKAVQEQLMRNWGWIPNYDDG